MWVEYMDIAFLKYFSYRTYILFIRSHHIFK